MTKRCFFSWPAILAVLACISLLGLPAAAQAPARLTEYSVGSEQNFTYIAATRPSVAILVDLRRGNLNLH
jgi:hypothetical protein